MPDSASDLAFQKVAKLVATFKANEERYLSANYQEAEVRKDFIDKFFIALGWDVNHDEQTNPYEQEVKVEPSVSASGQRRADYAFHLKPNFRDVRFFVEAKKPHGDIATKDNYFQTIRYGWNSETPLAVLTDFEQYLLDFEQQALLPSLNKNIVCGNSLIGTDILDGQLFIGDEERKLNPMDFEDRFPEIMKRGGFDAIVGNPPWGGDIDKQLDYFHHNYPATTKDHTDSFKLFIERGISRVREGGLSALKQLCEAREPITNRIPSTGPYRRNPIFGVVISRHVRQKESEAIVEDKNLIHDHLSAFDFSKFHSPDLMIAGRNNIVMPAIPHQQTGGQTGTVVSPFLVPSVSKLFAYKVDGLAFGTGMAALMWAIEWIELGNMHWSPIIAEGLGIPFV